MLSEHKLTADALTYIETELVAGRHWLAYNNNAYRLEKGDLFLFKNKEEAREFSNNNYSDYDNYAVVPVDSILDIMRSVTDYERLYGKRFNGEGPSVPDVNLLLNSQDVNAFSDALIEHFERNQFNHSNKTIVMNQENVKYLNDNLKYMGFGDSLNEAMEKNIREQKPEFSLQLQTEFNKKPVVADLHFRKSDSSDMYFFNRYDMKVMNEDASKNLSQTFYIDKGSGITLKESFNLLEGRAVEKQKVNASNEKYTSWYVLNFKEPDKNGNFKLHPYHHNYGFDLEKSLAKHPIKELQDETSRTRLMESLQRGNRQSITLDINGQDKKVFVEAAPQFKSLNFYDSNHQRIKADKLYETNSEKQPLKQETKKETQKQGASDEDGPEKKGQKKSGKNKQSIS